ASDSKQGTAFARKAAAEHPVLGSAQTWLRTNWQEQAAPSEPCVGGKIAWNRPESWVDRLEAAAHFAEPLLLDRTAGALGPPDCSCRSRAQSRRQSDQSRADEATESACERGTGLVGRSDEGGVRRGSKPHVRSVRIAILALRLVLGA